uniref:Stress-response A/B barrel domain-containing protein n=1 Tax=Kalanchoe fedtschenkoi TaxID=63787 RepID=A0A7N0US53_KALFE
MADFKHLAVVKFRPDVNVGEILQGVQALVSRIDTVKSLEWGEDLEGSEMVRQGFTHVIAVTFRNKEDYDAYVRHPEHVKFSAVFAQALDKVVVLDFQGMSVEQKVKESELPMPS